jgi:predicted DNA-binding transcriptional regulator AlpA
MINKWESLWSSKSRVQGGGTRKPLRTVAELADEFGISKMSLVNFMRNSDSSPKPRPLKNRSAVWYDADEVRKWWRETQ